MPALSPEHSIIDTSIRHFFGRHKILLAENIQKALDYELSFYGQIFGFETDVSDNIKKEVASKL